MNLGKGIIGNIGLKNCSRLLRYGCAVILVILNLAVLSPPKSEAAWVSFNDVKIANILTYPHGSGFIIITDPIPTVSLPACLQVSRFAVPGTVDPNQLQQVYSAALTALASGKTVDLSYDDSICELWAGSTNYLKLWNLIVKQ